MREDERAEGELSGEGKMLHCANETSQQLRQRDAVFTLLSFGGGKKAIESRG